MHTRALVPIALLALLPACLESEEELTVRPDGSVHVVLRSKGNVKDLADGYPIPLRGPWRAANEDTLAWIERIGPDTGGPMVARNVESLFASDEDKTLSVSADFARVEDLPGGWAPSEEPYADAYQRRSAKLTIERKGARTVYVLERTLFEREFARYDAWSAVQRELDDEGLIARIEGSQALSAEESARVADVAVRSLRSTAQALAEDTLAAIYVEGDASLSAAGRERASKAVADALANLPAFAGPGGIETTLRTLLERHDPEQSEGRAGTELAQLEQDLRATLRIALQEALGREGLPLAARNAVLGQLEWLLAANAHTADLGDETFVVRVRMPGSVVGGNFDALEDGSVVWKTSGTDLRDRTRVLRVVSVVE